MIFNLCAYWNETRGTVIKKKTNLLQYAIQLVCILKWNKRDSFQKKNTPIYYSMLFNPCAYWNQTRWTDFKKIQLMTICYWTRVRNETRGAVFQKHTNYYCMLFNLCAYWNETRGTVFKKKTPIYYSMLFNKGGSFQKTTIYYCMLFNLCAYWNETRGIVFKKNKKPNLLQYAIQLVCILKSNKMDRFQKNPIDDNMLLNSCAKWIERGSFPKTHKLLLYAIQLVCVLKWNKRGSFQKKQKKQQKHQFITVCYSTCVHIEIKQEGQFSKKKKKNTNLLQYTIQQEGQFSENNNLLLYDIQLVCVLKWNKRDSFQKKKTPIYCSMLFNKRGSFQKTTIYYCMIFNLCAYWNETRGTVIKKKPNLLQYAIQLVCILKWNKRDSFKKKIHQFITVCYSTHVHIEIKQDGQISKKSNWWQYATELVCGMKQEGQFSKNTQIITVCYSTCVRIEMKQEGQFSKKKTPIYYSAIQQEGQFSKNNNLLLYAIQLVCVLKWNKRDSFQKK